MTTATFPLNCLFSILNHFEVFNFTQVGHLLSCGFTGTMRFFMCISPILVLADFVSNKRMQVRNLFIFSLRFHAQFPRQEKFVMSEAFEVSLQTEDAAPRAGGNVGSG